MACNCQDCIIREVTIFSGLGANDLESIGQLIQLARYKKQQILFLEQNPAQMVFIIKSGRVKVSKVLEDGREQILRISKPGDILGFEALYENRYSVTAETISDAELCCLNKDMFFQLLQTNSRIALSMVKVLSRELEDARAKIRDLGLKDAREKVASFLMSQLPATDRAGSQGKRLHLELSRHEVSEMVGLTQETVSRILSEFKKDKIIEANRKEILILKPDRLSSLSG